MNRSSIPSITLALASLLVLGPACDDSVRTETLEFAAADAITQLDVRTGSGDVVVIAEAGRDHVDVEAEIHGDATRLRWDLDDGALTLDHRCPTTNIGSCAVDWTVWVPLTDAEGEPAQLDLVADTGSGNVRVEDLHGDVEAGTGSGDVVLHGVHASRFALDTGSGDVQVIGSAAESIGASTGSGDVRIDLHVVPRGVTLDTGSGDVHVTVPHDRYRLELHTSSGDVDIDGVIVDSSAGNVIVADTGSGDIRVDGR